MTMPLVLLTDDDKATLVAYKRHLRQHFRIALASSGREALHIIQSEVPDVIVSDLHMPMMNGMALLAEARRLVPTALRILLTGQPDLQNAIEAINTGEVFRLLTKPCPSKAIVAAIDDGLGRRAASAGPNDTGGLSVETEPMFTDHALRRAQQRAIPPIVVDWLTQFGSLRWSRGAAVYEFDKECIRRLRRYIGQRLFASVEHFLDAYVVIGGQETIVTVGWRQQRRKHR